MRYKLSDEQIHDLYCPVKHTKSALILVASLSFVALAGWKGLRKAPQRPNLLELLIAILVVVMLAKCIVIFKCFRERLVLGIAFASSVAGQIYGLFPAIVGPYAHAVKLGKLTLWVLAPLVSLTMFVQSARTPKVEPNELQVAMAHELKRNFLIVVVLVLATLLLSAMLYFVPLRWWS